MENILEVYNGNDELVAYMTEDGTIDGTSSNLISVTDTDADATFTAEVSASPASAAIIYTDNTDWDQVALFTTGKPEYEDFNGVVCIDTIPMNVKFKNSTTHEVSTTYDVEGTGKFLIYPDGSWEKIGEIQ